MLRLTFWILLAANVVMFAATQTYTDFPEKKDEPQQLQSVEPEKIRLLPSILITPQSGPVQQAITAEQASETTSCLEIGEFDTTGARLFGEKIKKLLPSDSVQKLQTQNPSSYMVYLPSAKNKKAAENRIGELQKKGIGIEMCPISNLQTKAVESTKDYPMREFLNAGLKVTANTDNRTVSNTTLTKELEFIQKNYGITDEEIHLMMRNAVDVAFADDAVKERMLKYV